MGRVHICKIGFFTGLLWALGGCANPQDTSPQDIPSVRAKGKQCLIRRGVEVCIQDRVNSSIDGWSSSQGVLWASSAASSGPTDLVIYLQGFRGVCQMSGGVSDGAARPLDFLEGYNIMEPLADWLRESTSRRKVFVFVPSAGRGATYEQEVLPSWAGMIAWAEKTFKPDTWSIVGHSGAGSVIARGLSRHLRSPTKWSSITLLDATYGIPQHLAAWKGIARAHREVLIESIYRPGSPTSAGSEVLEKELNLDQVDGNPTLKTKMKLTKTNDGHCDVPASWMNSMAGKEFLE